MPDFIPSPELNKILSSTRIQLTESWKIDDKGSSCRGDRLGKTIIFAQNKKHAEYIVERLTSSTPVPRNLCEKVVCDNNYADYN